MQKQLPVEWINAIFDKLTIRYGKAFLNRWEGINMNAVKADWACHLAGMESRPEAIKHALSNLPESYPPTVGQFRELCNRAPEYHKALPAPEVDAKVKTAALDGLQSAFEAGRVGDPKAWAKKIIARHKAGENVRKISLEFAREALRI